jgi:hypothetical protein
MTEIQQFLFTHKEIAEMLIKRKDVHEGYWGICVEFGILVGTVEFPPQSGNTNPGTTVSIPKIGIQRFDASNPLAINAAEVNPPITSGDKGKRGNKPSQARK